MRDEHDTPAVDPEFRMLTFAEFEELTLAERMAYLRRAVRALKSPALRELEAALRKPAQAAAAPRAACRGR